MKKILIASLIALLLPIASVFAGDSLGGSRSPSELKDYLASLKTLYVAGTLTVGGSNGQVAASCPGFGTYVLLRSTGASTSTFWGSWQTDQTKSSMTLTNAGGTDGGNFSRSFTQPAPSSPTVVTVNLIAGTSIYYYMECLNQ